MPFSNPAADHPAKRALILDFDGVVVETEALHFACWNRTFEEFDGRRVSGDHRQLVGLTLEQIFAHWSQAGDSPLDLTHVQKERLLARKTELYFALGKTSLVPMSGLVPLIRRAQAEDWYIAIASRARRRRLMGTLDLLNLPPIFDVVMGSEDVVDPVSDRKRHSRVVAPFGILPSHCVVVEDSASGVADAGADGIGQVIGLTTSLTGDALFAAGAHRVVTHLDEIDLLNAVVP